MVEKVYRQLEGNLQRESALAIELERNLPDRGLGHMSQTYLMGEFSVYDSSGDGVPG